jgi:hypothetical protein
MMPLMDDVAKLKAQLAELSSQQGAQQADLTRQLDQFSQQLDALALQVQAQNNNEQPIALSDENIHAPVHKSRPNDSSGSIVADTPQYSSAAWERQSLDTSHSASTSSISAQQTSVVTKSPARQSALSAMVAQLAEAIGELSTSAFSPLSGLTEQAKEFYQHYQTKGLGPVFLMTVAGIITLTLGFGYLLQFSINNWFSELGKALLGLGVANSIIAGGVLACRTLALGLLA